jgi:hypothetical protein
MYHPVRDILPLLALTSRHFPQQRGIKGFGFLRDTDFVCHHIEAGSEDELSRVFTCDKETGT